MTQKLSNTLDPGDDVDGDHIEHGLGPLNLAIQFVDKRPPNEEEDQDQSDIEDGVNQSLDIHTPVEPAVDFNLQVVDEDPEAEVDVDEFHLHCFLHVA